jgi:hypothetical protein
MEPTVTVTLTGLESRTLAKAIGAYIKHGAKVTELDTLRGVAKKVLVSIDELVQQELFIGLDNEGKDTASVFSSVSILDDTEEAGVSGKGHAL